MMGFLIVANGIIRSLRPKQWMKNLFIVVPVIFTKKITDLYVDVRMIAAFGLFCLLAGCVYLINDVVDIEKDRQHTDKKNRPLPSGKITRAQAIISAVLIFCVCISLSFCLDRFFGVMVSFYIVINICYSFWLKNIIIVDVITIAIGFILRVLSGGSIVGVPSSDWIIMSTLFISLFMGFSKRRGEILEKNNLEVVGSSRKVLEFYSPELLDNFLLITATGAIISYAVYTTSDYVYGKFGTHNLIYTTIFVVYGVLRYYYLIHKIHKKSSNPTDILLCDYPMIINLVLWILACILIIGI